MRTAKLKHKISELTVLEVRVSRAAARETRVVDAGVAYRLSNGSTCGRLTVQRPMLSEDTLKKLDEFLDMVEEDAAKIVFEVGDNKDNASVEPL